MSALRAFSKHARSLSRTSLSSRPSSISSIRAFHSPFKSLSDSPLTSPPHPSSTVSTLYEKQLDHSPDPQLSSAGTHTYVVSEPDPAHTPYEVPYGAYPTSAPYQNFPAADGADGEAPRTSSSTASTSHTLAHPLTSALPQNPSGVMESSAIRHGTAPGEMHQRGGSHGGLGMMDMMGTKSKGTLVDRNPPPDSPGVAEKFSKQGVDNAWKERK
ncbi:uncharacterized protein FIBRA_06407 [Fibroporia radiculosa]|uniref:Uncharacterized protein n=1 Tax=Fibroporia radiculosa TaxID=599839 RepID=J4GSP3_9APHY|nr:uncharacterized protein FIBRA_06407 [Fibroporia radiculosa]CCM04240.1 predicted protein [Fibroporia radiculosa]